MKKKYLGIIIFAFFSVAILIVSFLLGINQNITFLQKINYIFTIPLGIIGAIFTIYKLFDLVKETKLRNDNEKRKYATNMILEWNSNSVHNTNLILKYFPNCLQNCKPIDIEKLAISNNSGDLKKIKQELKDAIKALLNYFEYVAVAYVNCANKEIILNSFSITMIRYYVVLQRFLLEDLKNTHRNHWKPFTEFISIIKKDKDETVKICNLCIDRKDYEKCKIFDNNFDEILRLLNKDKLDNTDNEKIITSIKNI